MQKLSFVLTILGLGKKYNFAPVGPLNGISKPNFWKSDFAIIQNLQKSTFIVNPVKIGWSTRLPYLNVYLAVTASI